MHQVDSWIFAWFDFRRRSAEPTFLMVEIHQRGISAAMLSTSSRIFVLALITLLSGCATTDAIPDQFLSRSDPGLLTRGPITEEVTQLFVDKSERRLYLMSGNTPVREYQIDLGFAPDGGKARQGDGKTPEGLYYIDRRNPKSAYYLSIGISYPNEEDTRLAAAAGMNPGGDIFIHGVGSENARSGNDWTAGCIALPNADMEAVFNAVEIGTPILIVP